MPSIDTIIDGLSWHSCCEILTEYDAPPSNHNTVEQLQTTVRDMFERGEIPPWVIRSHANDDRDARLLAANRIIQDLTQDVAEKHARIKELEALLAPVNQSIFRE